MAAITAAVLTAPTLATASETSLCLEDTAESPCPEEQAATHVHYVTTEKAKLLTSILNVECDVLFLGNTAESSEAPLFIEGNFTYTSCKRSSESCAVNEENGPVLISVIKTGHETANVTGEGEVHVKCGAFINCYYEGDELLGKGTGPLLSVATNGEISLQGQETHKVKGSLCPSTALLDIRVTPLEELYIQGGNGPPGHGGAKEPSVTYKTALCTTDEPTAICLEEHKLSSIDFKDSAVEFLTNLLNIKCEGLFSGTVGAAGKPQAINVESKFSGCSNGCVITEISGGSQLLYELEESTSSELAYVTVNNFELFIKCGSAVKCAFGPIKITGEGEGPLLTSDNGHLTFDRTLLGENEGLLCPEENETTLDALFVASSPAYIREDYGKPPTSLCSKDEKSPFCKSENQLKSIDYKDKAVELLTNLINVKCEGLASGTVGAPGNPLEVKAELTYTGCSGGCFVTAVSGPGKVLLQREGKAEEAKATTEGFEIFVKCGTTIKCLLGPEKMTGTALGALTTGDNGHLTFSKASMGKGEGATCPKEATLDALYVASSTAYIG
jgi:hypothetical protein